MAVGHAKVVKDGRRVKRMDALGSVLGFVVFAALWVAFGYALVASQGSLDAAWEWLRGLPLVLQGLATFLLLPLVVALWVWETSWPLVLRVALVGGLAAFNLYTFFPRDLLGGRM